MMDLEQLVRDHPKLIADIISSSSGPLGELLVARELQRRGCRVDVLNGHDRQRDLSVLAPDESRFFIETKTVRILKRTRKGGIPSVTWLVNTKPDPTRSQFWFLVVTIRDPISLPRDEDVIFYILTAEEAEAAWKQGPINPSVGDIRTGSLPPNCENAFAKLGCWADDQGVVRAG